MKIGIQYQKQLTKEIIKTSEFQSIEFPKAFMEYAESGFSVQGRKGLIPSGVHLVSTPDPEDLQQKLKETLYHAEKLQMEYIVIETNGVSQPDYISASIKSCLNSIKNSNIKILIENGYCKGQDGYFYHGPFSDAKQLSVMADELNHTVADRFGIAFNVGNANLLGQNMAAMIEILGDRIKLVHANDNDGKRDLRQMPYTFSTGRGALATDWYRMIGALARMNYNGYMIFNTTGLFDKMPVNIQGSILSLLYAVSKEWEKIINIEVKLDQPDKKLILFGSGIMANNFMVEWGDRYRPAYIADNNQNLWGSKKWEIEIISPLKIVEIPPEQRNVWICNQYYDQVGKQLEELGIEYECYQDHYFYYT